MTESTHRDRDLAGDMSRRRFIGAAGAAAGLAFGAVAPAKALVAVPRYRTLYIGPWAPGDLEGFTIMQDFNDAGEAVGIYATTPRSSPQPDSAAFYFRPNPDFTGGDFVQVTSLIDPGVLATLPMFRIWGWVSINAAGVIAGMSDTHPNGPDNPGVNRLFRLLPPATAGAYWTLELGPDFAPGYGAYNPRINDAGDVVFHSYTDATANGNYEMHAMIWPWGAASFIDVGTPVAGAKVFTTNSARAGELVMISAYLVSNTSYDRAYRIDYHLGTGARNFRFLGTLTRNAMSDQAHDVNTSGLVVGEANAKSGSVTDRAFRWTQATRMVALGTFGGEDSFGHAVNEAGDIVGQAEYAPVKRNPPISAPFLYTPSDGKMWDVSKLIDGPRPSYLGDQQLRLFINNQRMIAGPNVGAAGWGPAYGKAAFLLVPTT